MLELLTLAFIVIVSSILVLAIYFNNPRSATNRAYVFAGLSSIFWSTVMYLSLHPPEMSQTLFYIRLSMLAGSLMATSFLTLALIFPEIKVKLNKSTLVSIYTLALLTMIVAMSQYMFTGLEYIDGEPTPTPGPGIILFAITAIGYNILTVIVLIRKYLKSNGRIKQQIYYMLLGIGLMFGLMIVANFILVVVFETSSFIALGPLFTIFFLASTGYAIIRHRLLDIRVLVARTVSYTLITFLVVAGYVLVLFWLADTVSGVEVPMNLTIALSIVSIILFFSAKTVQRGVEVVTDRIFFKAGYNTEELLSQLTKQMASNIELDILSEKILSLLISNVKLSKGAFILLRDHKISNIESVGYKNLNTSELMWVESIVHTKKPIFIYEELEEGDLKASFGQLDISIALPLSVNEKEIGIFIAGPKASGEIYSSQDVELFEILAPQLAVALQNAQSYAQIQQFSRTLERKVDERTRELKVAQENEIARARQLIKLKDEFVFVATHDLKTPVTAINGYISMIKENPDEVPEKLKEKLNSIEDSSKRLMQLVDDLLEVARSESGTIKIKVEPVETQKVVNSIIKEVQTLADQRGITIETDISPNSDVLADHKKLEEVLENLLSNAVKYNKDGGHVKVSARIDDDRKNVLLSVSDTGVGIPDDVQSKIFTKFFRAKQAGTEDVSGTGLGLFVVRMLVQKMKGKIVFKSKEGIGTTFLIKLPAA